MRCRYCGKELALLKRLTGGGEFCSEAHKQSYHDEYNRLALGRLLQAQKKGQTESSGNKTGPPTAAPVAVEEPAAEESIREERAADAPVVESAPLEINSLEASVTKDEPAEAKTEHEAEPSEIANFLIDSPAMAALPDEAPYVEPWLQLSSEPAVAAWHFRKEGSALSTAAPFPLALQPNASPIEHPFAPADLTPRDFTNVPGQPALSWKTATLRQLPSAGPVSIKVAASAVDFAADRSIAQELDFETAVLVEESPLLELPSTGIEFPTEDSGVVVSQGNVFRQVHGAAIDSVPLEADPAVVEDDGPRASLEALSRLHQDLVHEDLTLKELVQEDLVQKEEATTEQSAHQAAEQTPATEAEPVAESEMPSGGSTPERATALLAIALRMFPPAKPVPIEGSALPSQSEPLLPHLKSLPLRPKVAVASGYVPPSTTPAEPQATASARQTAPSPAAAAQTAPPPTAARDPRAAAPSKSGPAKAAPTATPASRIALSKQPPAPAKAPSSVKTSEPVPSEPSKAAAKLQPPAPAQPEAGASVKATRPPAKSIVEETANEIAKPAAKQPPTQSVKQGPGEPVREPVPNFGAIQLANPSFIGSLKVKLGIAITLLVVACSTWLGWGGKSRKPAESNPAISADGSGPSIILGEGGWVEGWGGDPSGVHSDRQITIYRPSLKLSDYRIEFQASIDTKSIGWVFRATDPDNYYALKLMTVSSGLSTKVALFKYLVINGRQTQVGRVPIDLTVQADTVFDIRTDVQGPQFSTYIQGRQVDVWTDDQLKVGGVGFLNEREERGKIKSVSIRYLNGAAK